MWARERHGGRESSVHLRPCTWDVLSGILLGRQQGDMRVRPAGSACCPGSAALCRSMMETAPLCREGEEVRLETGISRDHCGGPSKK